MKYLNLNVWHKIKIRNNGNKEKKEIKSVVVFKDSVQSIDASFVSEWY